MEKSNKIIIFAPLKTTKSGAHRDKNCKFAMVKKIYPTCVMFDNYDLDNFGTREDYEQYCEDFNMPIGNYNDFYDWQCEMETLEWDDFEVNIKSSEYNEAYVAIEGSVGTWRGEFEIQATVVCGLLKAIKKCINQCDYFSIKLEDGAIHVRASHHDGTNCFTIKPLSKKGEHLDAGSYSDFKSYYTKKIKGYLF